MKLLIQTVSIDITYSKGLQTRVKSTSDKERFMVQYVSYDQRNSTFVGLKSLILDSNIRPLMS